MSRRGSQTWPSERLSIENSQIVWRMDADCADYLATYIELEFGGSRDLAVEDAKQLRLLIAELEETEESYRVPRSSQTPVN